MIAKPISHLEGKTIHVPYNNDLRLVDEVFKLGIENINVCFYFSPSPELSGTGRRLPFFDKFEKNGEFDNNIFEEEMFKFLYACKDKGFKTNLLLNSVLLGMPYSNEDLTEKIPKIQKYLESLDKHNLISLVTIGNPYLLELLNLDKLKNIKIKTSVNLQIKSAESIELLNILLRHFYTGMLEEVEIQKDLLRDIPVLKKIRSEIKGAVKLSILVNEGCLTGCPYQQVHQIHSCSIPITALKNYDESFKFGIAKCKHITAIDPWRFLKSNWVLPEQLEKYTDIIDSIKITGRSDTTDEIINTLKAYVFYDYDESNLNKIISLMKMETWKFPKSALPSDFDKVLYGEDFPDSYYENIFKKIKIYNENRSKQISINFKGFIGKKLHDYEGL